MDVDSKIKDDADERKDRERDRERERDADRDRDRERDRDRHRKDDRERDRDSRKDREGAARGAGTPSAGTPAADDRGLPSRPDAARRRDEDSLGKRRRATDDDVRHIFCSDGVQTLTRAVQPDRASKRMSRKDGHHEDRSRRASDKDSHDRPRDSDRRRKDREQPESGEPRGNLTIDTKVRGRNMFGLRGVLTR